MAAPFNDQNIALVPQANGIYRLYRHGALIYIGKANGALSTIRSRLQSHMQGDEGKCTQSATEFDYEVSTNPDVREAALIASYSAMNSGKRPECNEVQPMGGLINSVLRRTQ